MIFVSDAVPYNNLLDFDEKLYNIIILSLDGERLTNYYCNLKDGRDNMIMLFAQRFLECQQVEEKKETSQEKFNEIQLELFNSRMTYTLGNLIYILKNKFNAQEVTLSDLSTYISEYKMFEGYYEKIEDYTEGRIRRGDDYSIFLTNDENNEQIYNGSYRTYNVIFISHNNNLVKNAFCNIKYNGELIEYIVQEFVNNNRVG